MKPGVSNSRMVHRRDRKSRTNRSLEARSRGARLKLEDLEIRTLLSTTSVFGPELLPEGLGTAYTAMAEQAYGVNLHTTTPGQLPQGWPTSTSTSNPVTLADLEAYLKGLGVNHDAINNSGAGGSQPNQGNPSVGLGAPTPVRAPSSTTREIPIRPISITNRTRIIPSKKASRSSAFMTRPRCSSI